MFILADKKNKGLLNETEILGLLQQLSVTAPARVVKLKFKVCSATFCSFQAEYWILYIILDELHIIIRFQFILVSHQVFSQITE